MSSQVQKERGVTQAAQLNAGEFEMTFSAESSGSAAISLTKTNPTMNEVMLQMPHENVNDLLLRP
jgi:hypothetical protein